MNHLFPGSVFTSSSAGRSPVSQRSLKYFVGLSDFGAVVTASLVAGIGYNWMIVGDDERFGRFLAFGVLFAALYVPCLALCGTRHISAITDPAVIRTTAFTFTAVVLLSFSGVLFLADVGPDIWSGFVGFFALTLPSFIFIERIAVSQIVSRALSRGQIEGRPIILIHEGDGDTATQQFYFGSTEYQIVKIVRLPIPSAETYSQREFSAFATQIADWVRDLDVDEVHIALDWLHWGELKRLVDELQVTPVPVRILPDATVRDIIRRSRVSPGGKLSFEVKSTPLSSVQQIHKRMLDLFIASTGLLLCLPILVIVSLAIRLDSQGPILFQQARRGLNGKVFRIYKFRTMSVMEDGPRVTQVIRNDPRVTRVGRILRRWSLDEVPQLVNVLRGEMSLVGPRPHAVTHDDEFSRLVSNYTLRSHVKPGITGWAQIQGMRGETPTTEAVRRRVEMDLFYINNCSILLDVQILARTAVAIFSNRNAY